VDRDGWLCGPANERQPREKHNLKKNVVASGPTPRRSETKISPDDYSLHPVISRPVNKKDGARSRHGEILRRRRHEKEQKQ
jgi:hypothetical protein